VVSDSASWSGPTSPPAADRPAKPGQAAPVRAKRKGKNPGLASIYRALAQHQKRQRYPEAVEQAHADFAAYPPDFSRVLRRPGYASIDGEPFCRDDATAADAVGGRTATTHR